MAAAAAGSILLSNREGPGRGKTPWACIGRGERTLGIINSNRPMTVNREEPVRAAFYFNHPLPMYYPHPHPHPHPILLLLLPPPHQSYEICTRQTEVGLMLGPASTMTNRYTSSTITYL